MSSYRFTCHVKAQNADAAVRKAVQRLDDEEEGFFSAYPTTFKVGAITTQARAMGRLNNMRGEKTYVTPVCRKEDVVTKTLEMPVSLDGEQYEKYVQFMRSNEFAPLHETIRFFQNSLGVTLPADLDAVPDTGVVSISNLNGWKLSSTVKSTTNEGSLVKKFYVVATDGTHSPARVLSGSYHDSQREAIAEAREWMDANPNAAEVVLDIHSKNVRSGGSDSLSTFSRVIDKATVVLGLTVETVGAEAQQNGYVVSIHSSR